MDPVEAVSKFVFTGRSVVPWQCCIPPEMDMSAFAIHSTKETASTNSILNNRRAARILIKGLSARAEAFRIASLLCSKEFRWTRLRSLPKIRQDGLDSFVFRCRPQTVQSVDEHTVGS